MSTYTPEEVEERFARLPESLKEEMMSVENSERIFEVGKKFGLTIEQIGFLAEESGYVVLGLTHPKDFVAKLKDHLRVDEEKAKTIAKEINHRVFFPLREILKTTHQFELTQEQIQDPPLPIPSMPRAEPPSQKPSPVFGEARPTGRPIPQGENRSVGQPAIQGENRPTGQSVPITATPSVNKPIVPPPATPSVDIKIPIIPIPRQPSVIVIPPIPTISSQTPPSQPPSPTPVPTAQTIPHPPEKHSDVALIWNPKTTVPILPPPSRTIDGASTRINEPSQAINPTQINTSSSPTGRQMPPPLSHLNLSALDEKKSETPNLPLLQSENRPIGQSAATATSKSIEGIKPKEPTPPTPPPIPPSPELPQPPLAPSQIMQKKLLEETKHIKVPAQPQVERMKESLFAPPSAPLQQPKPVPPSIPTPPAKTPAPSSEPTPKPPLSYSNRDPYREPIE